MFQPMVTAAAGGALGLIFVVLSARVVLARQATSTILGHGDDVAGPLAVAVRSHANFAEFVPLCLLLIGAVELHFGSTLLVKVLAAVLVLARVAHPVGMGRRAPNPFRAAGFVGTILVLAIASFAAITTLFM